DSDEEESDQGAGDRRARREVLGQVGGHHEGDRPRQLARVPRRRTASPASTSSTTRWALLTVSSAQSYGGATSTTSSATSGVSIASWRTARSRSAGAIPPGSG